MADRKRVTPKKTASGTKTAHQKYQNKNRRRFQQIVAIVLIVGLVGGLGATATWLFFLSGGDDTAIETSTTTLADNNATTPCPPTTTPEPKEQPADRAPVTAEIDPSKTYIATMATSCGTMAFELLPETAEVDVANFVGLANEGYYNNTIFHRVLKDFVIQGGDPTGANPDLAGRGGPGYKYTGSTPATPEDGSSVYRVGDLAMANSSDPSTNGSQFFIVSGPQGEALPPNYSLFGKLVDGLDVVKSIQSMPASTSAGAQGYPQNPVVINTITISEQ